MQKVHLPKALVVLKKFWLLLKTIITLAEHEQLGSSNGVHLTVDVNRAKRTSSVKWCSTIVTNSVPRFWICVEKKSYDVS